VTVKAVFFDFHGTLFVMHHARAELEEWITELHTRLTRSGLTATRDRIWNYYHDRMWKENPPKPDNDMTIFERRIQIACSDFEVNMTRAQITETAEALIGVWDKYAQLDPACIPLLDSLTAQGKTIALISNYDHPQHIHDLVQMLGIKDRFVTVIVSGDHGIHKPDPAIFRLALERTGMKAGDAIYVGDSQEDIVGANRAGMISVLIDRSGSEPRFGQRYTISALPDVFTLALRE